LCLSETEQEEAGENNRRSNNELLQLFGDLDILSLVRTSGLNWIGHVKRMNNTRKASQVLKNNPWGSRLKGRPKNGWLNCVQTDNNKRQITNWGERSKTELTARSPLREQRSALNCSGIEEEEEEEEDEKEEEENSMKRAFVICAPTHSFFS
jgi:hypothetical protein